jgi:hypothetical protein
MKKIILLFSLMVFSCAGHIEVVPRGCFSENPNFTWALDFDPEFNPDFIIKKRVWTHGFTGENSTADQIFLKSFLGESGVDCRDIKMIKVAIDQSSKDVILSILPFISRHTVTVEGMYTN